MDLTNSGAICLLCRSPCVQVARRRENSYRITDSLGRSVSARVRNG